MLKKCHFLHFMSRYSTFSEKSTIIAEYNDYYDNDFIVTTFNNGKLITNHNFIYIDSSRDAVITKIEGKWDYLFFSVGKDCIIDILRGDDCMFSSYRSINNCKLRKDAYGKIITKGLYIPTGPFYVTL